MAEPSATSAEAAGGTYVGHTSRSSAATPRSGVFRAHAPGDCASAATDRGSSAVSRCSPPWLASRRAQGPWQSCSLSVLFVSRHCRDKTKADLYQAIKLVVICMHASPQVGLRSGCHSTSLPAFPTVATCVAVPSLQTRNSQLRVIPRTRSPRAPGGSPTPHTIGAHTYTPALRTVHVSQQCNQVRVRARRCVQSHPHMRIPVRCRAYAVIVGTCLRTQHPAMASSFQSSRGGTCRLLTWLRVASLCSQLLGARNHLICHHQT